MSFYCNPRIQLAVVNKIVMQGLNASAVSFGNYVENYLYSEEIYEGDAIPELDLVNDKKKKSFRFYDVSNVVNVFVYQVLYILLTPLIALREIFLALKVSMIRDFFKGILRNYVNPIKLN